MLCFLWLDGISSRHAGLPKKKCALFILLLVFYVGSLLFRCRTGKEYPHAGPAAVDYLLRYVFVFLWLTSSLVRNGLES